MLTKKPRTKTNLNFKIFFTSLFLILFFSLSISAIATAASCGDGELDPGEECDPNPSRTITAVCKGKNLVCTSECKCESCVPNCDCAKNLASSQSCFGGCGETCRGSESKLPNTCGNDIKEGSEECDFNSAFGPYPNQCPNNGACNQATCKCSSGGGITPGTTPTPVAGPASFSADKTSGTAPLTVNFTLTNGTGCINYLCEPEVGTQKYVYEKSFSCTYNTAGTYTASISCNGNKITKTITVTGAGTSTTPTPTVTPTPTPNSPNVKPADYVSIAEPYHRAPEDNKEMDGNGNWTGAYSEYYSFTISDTDIGYLPHLRAFVPPGTRSLSMFIIEGGDQWAVARHKSPPIGEPQSRPADYIPSSNFSLQELISADQWAQEALQGYLVVSTAGINPSVPISDAGWLYVKVGGGAYSYRYFTHFSVTVEIKTYNAWWDKYIKDEAGWNKYIENVETYIDPTICLLYTSPSPRDRTRSRMPSSA